MHVYEPLKSDHAEPGVIYGLRNTEEPLSLLSFRIDRLKAPRSPHLPAHGRLLVHFGGCKLILGQIIGQTELLIFLILGWGTNKDLPVSRVRVDVVVFSVPLHQRHFIWRERFEMLLPLRSVSDDRSESCSREQVLCLLRISAAYSQG